VGALAADNVPSWVLSDYVLWELFDYMNEGSSYIAYNNAQVHINLEVVDSMTKIYFNKELPLIEKGVTYNYIPYMPETAKSPHGDWSNGGTTPDQPLPLGYAENSDSYFNYSMIPYEDVKIFKDYVAANPTTLYLGYTPAANQPAATANYVQLSRMLYDISSNESKLSLVVQADATLSLTHPVTLQAIDLTSGSTLDLSGLSDNDLNNHVSTAIHAQDATIILPANSSDEKVSAFLQKYALEADNVNIFVPKTPVEHASIDLRKTDNDTITATFTIDNTDGNTQGALCFIAFYDAQNVLIGTELKSVTIAAGVNDTFDILAPFGKAASVKAFIWSVADYLPLCEAAKLTP
jgi:hypothetical protein